MGLVDQGTPSQPKPHIPTPLIFSSFFLFSLSFPPHYFLFISILLPTFNSRPGDSGLYLREGRSQKGATHLAFSGKK